MSNERCATMILCRAGHRIAARMGRPVLHELWRTTRFSPAAAIFCRYLPQIAGQDRTFEFGSWTAPGATRMRNRSACTEQKFFSAPREEVPCFAVGFILIVFLALGETGHMTAVLLRRLPNSTAAGIKYQTSSGMTYAAKRSISSSE